MNQNDLADLLRSAAADTDVGPAPTDLIVAAGRRRVRRRRAVEVLGTVAAVTAVAVLVPLGVGRVPVTPAAAPGSCAPLVTGVLPDWARAGFSEPEPVSSYVLGDRGEIVAIPFGPLTSPPTAGRTNKVLWVVRVPPGPGPLVITARLPGLAPVVREVAEGPGPSTVDLPAAGCWRVDLSWPGGGDALDLRYAPG